MSASPASAENPPGSSSDDLSFSSTSQLEKSHSGTSQPALAESGRCAHLRACLAEEPARTKILTKYKAVISWSVNRSQDTKHTAKRRKVRSRLQTKYELSPIIIQIATPTCDICDFTLSRPFVCLQCSFGGCWAKGHILHHLKSNDHGFCKSYFSWFISAVLVA